MKRAIAAVKAAYFSPNACQSSRKHESIKNSSIADACQGNDHNKVQSLHFTHTLFHNLAATFRHGAAARWSIQGHLWIKVPTQVGLGVGRCLGGEGGCVCVCVCVRIKEA